MTPATFEGVIASPAGEYNRAVWTEKVNRYLALGAEFFQVKGEDTFYVKYKIREGLIFFSEITMHSMLHSGGFTRVIIFPHGCGNFEVSYKGFGDSGKERVVNTREGRKWLVDNICKYGTPVTNN